MLLAGRDQNGVPGFDALLTVLITNLALPFNQPLFKAVLFTKALDFIKAHIAKRKVLIHCNHGKSRSASIALL
jgi:predicted protein tyrosine phosphatase